MGQEKKSGYLASLRGYLRSHAPNLFHILRYTYRDWLRV